MGKHASIRMINKTGEIKTCLYNNQTKRVAVKAADNELLECIFCPIFYDAFHSEDGKRR